MRAKISNSIFLYLFIFSFIFLIFHLNFNVRSFEKSHVLQELTLEIQQLKKDVDQMELDYYSKISLDNLYKVASERLDMVRQNDIHVFSNRDIQSR